MNRAVGVLVVFYSAAGMREALALAAAVGAVEARGLVRLRRLGSGERPGRGTHEVLERMRREYVEPARSDVEWADVIVLCVPDTQERWARFQVLLSEVGADGALDGKVGVIVPSERRTTDEGPGIGGWLAALYELGLIVVPVTHSVPDPSDPDAWTRRARIAGRRGVSVARALARAPTRERDARELL